MPGQQWPGSSMFYWAIDSSQPISMSASYLRQRVISFFSKKKPPGISRRFF